MKEMNSTRNLKSTSKRKLLWAKIRTKD